MDPIILRIWDYAWSSGALPRACSPPTCKSLPNSQVAACLCESLPEALLPLFGSIGKFDQSQLFSIKFGKHREIRFNQWKYSQSILIPNILQNIKIRRCWVFSSFLILGPIFPLCAALFSHCGLPYLPFAVHPSNHPEHPFDHPRSFYARSSATAPSQIIPCNP